MTKGMMKMTTSPETAMTAVVGTKAVGMGGRLTIATKTMEAERFSFCGGSALGGVGNRHGGGGGDRGGYHGDECGGRTCSTSGSPRASPPSNA